MNDAFLPGPDLLCDLIGIFIRFRLFPIAVCGDIEAMFMQVEVPVHEQNFLKFLWREGVSDEIEIFQYTRHIFGRKSSPTCANFAVQKVASDNKVDFPQAAETVFDSFHVDDFLSDSSTVIHWIYSSHKKLAVSVANRVAEILDNTRFDQWWFVPGIWNPADLGTRG